MSNLTRFRKSLIKTCKKPFELWYDLTLWIYVYWIIKFDDVREEAAEFVYKMNEKMRD